MFPLKNQVGKECVKALHKLFYSILCTCIYFLGQENGQKLRFFFQNQRKLPSTDYTVGGIAHICFKQWFQITADPHPGVSGVSKDQKFCEKFKNTHCQVDHPAKIE